ncbi:hypothetical protein EI42_04226 [Thermosporothrix hazakensis]|uniref:Uncharacterized protein n=1 Tax=Thermosporothrix hazakensis TaxID=644383 RepID=A0A326U5T5_THEHA|nr:hypothetical protein EI42_04226 [Thermosporothrix hazakensis]
MSRFRRGTVFFYKILTGDAKNTIMRKRLDGYAVLYMWEQKYLCHEIDNFAFSFIESYRERI